MSDWLSNLNSFFLNREPFVLATITSIEGSSPDVPGAWVFCSAANTVGHINSDNRREKIRSIAISLLAEHAPHDTQAHYKIAELALGNIANTANGHCTVLFEYFDATQYPAWLTTLRDNHKKDIDTALIRELPHNATAKIKTTVTTDFEYAQKIINVKNTRAQSTLPRCGFVVSNECSFILRTVINSRLMLSLVGDHAVADEIDRQVNALPVSITRVTVKQNYDPSWLQNIPHNSYVIVMTGDHHLDYHYCSDALHHEYLRYVGCIGSQRKAQLFKDRLLQSGASTDQLSRLYMPVGLKQIAGKQYAVVAASIVAQLMSLHDWAQAE